MHIAVIEALFPASPRRGDTFNKPFARVGTYCCDVVHALQRCSVFGEFPLLPCKVYAPGEWDLFHHGHVRFLRRARELGDVLLLGCYADSTINAKRGANYPLQTCLPRGRAR